MYRRRALVCLVLVIAFAAGCSSSGGFAADKPNGPQIEIIVPGGHTRVHAHEVDYAPAGHTSKQVGAVVGTTRTSNETRIQVRLDSGVRIPANAVARVCRNRVQLVRPFAPVSELLVDGDVLAADRTETRDQNC